MTPRLFIKMILPAAFFGYAALANLTLVTATQLHAPRLDGLWNGAITTDIDTIYRENLPHKSMSVGLIGAARYLLLGEGREGVVVGRSAHLFTVEEFRNPPDHAATYERALRAIYSARDQLAAEGAKLVILPVPAKVDLLAEYSPDAAKSAAMKGLYAQFLHDLRAQGVTVSDPRPALAALLSPFLATDTHWTPEGARAAAHMLAQSALVDAGDTAFRVEREAPQSFAGDLVSYVTSDALAPLIGLPAETAQPYTALAEPDPLATGVIDIFGAGDGAEASQIDLTGSSYSANPNWSFAEALKLELGRDVINYAVEGQGPFAPMRDYLAQRDAAGAAGTVLWEIPLRYLLDAEMVSKAEDRS